MSLKPEKRSPSRVLVVDDEEDIRELLQLTLARMGLESDGAGTLAEAKRLLGQNGPYQLCLTDMRLPDGDGLDLVRKIGESSQDLPVAVITAYGSMESAVAALKAGAFDYLSKPVSLDSLRALVRSALRLSAAPAGDPRGTAALLGESPPMVQIRQLIAKLARSMAPIYISGESGSGKELAARQIHAEGARSAQPFVAVNCGAIPENLMESEFFGHRKGAFTGADAEREGFFQAAHGGTLFLDEVADLPLAMQVKLLRAIQEKRVRRIGGTSEEPVDVRIISATHQNLRQLVETGRFRQDLFYRLNVIELHMPALRECREDVPLLARHILTRLCREAGLEPPHISAPALAALSAYPFPGNVRELENILERALALSGSGILGEEDLGLCPVPLSGEPDADDAASLQEYLDSQERRAILEALSKTGFNRTAAAKLLGVTFRSLRYRMERLGITE
ncbi:MAG: sigma-54 dependent transcriptional regulator [Rhodocyclaceae bacterium]|nr:sigma-54 dependent transcriptional regulator [Rhodocyclaceae bacterium]